MKKWGFNFSWLKVLKSQRRRIMAGRKNLAALALPSNICDMDKELKTAGQEELVRIPLFSQLTEADRKRLASITKKRSYFRGATIFKDGDAGGRLCILCKGMVKLTRLIRQNQVQILAELHSGDVFEEKSLISDSKHSSTALCMTNAVVLTINKADFDKMTLENPALGINVLKLINVSVCSYIRDLKSKICDMIDYVTAEC